MRLALRLGIFVATILLTVPCFGGARHFTFLYEAPTSAPGSVESENWITWERLTNPERSDQIGFRHEIEIGVTDHPFKLASISSIGRTHATASNPASIIRIPQSS